jgi:deazaflavin-dependent oxidoreductase (nitroreductase family)
MTDRHHQVIDEFRATGGQVGGYLAGLSLLLLTTTGARTGHRRTTALTYHPDGPGRYVVVAANGGRDRGPDWLHNLIADPAVTLEVGGEEFAATARVESGAGRDRLYAAFASQNPQVLGYAARRTKPIPVVTLHRTPAPV